MAQPFDTVARRENGETRADSRSGVNRWRAIRPGARRAGAAVRAAADPQDELVNELDRVRLEIPAVTDGGLEAQRFELGSAFAECDQQRAEQGGDVKPRRDGYVDGDSASGRAQDEPASQPEDVQ